MKHLNNPYLTILTLGLFTWLCYASYPQDRGYSVSDRAAMDKLVARSIKPHGKLSEPEQYKLAVYLWEGGVRK